MKKRGGGRDDAFMKEGKRGRNEQGGAGGEAIGTPLPVT